MAIPQSLLRASVTQSDLASKFMLEFRQAISAKIRTGFLCHSHKDEALALTVESFLRKNGWDIYIDWKDSSMPNKPSKETALKIKSKIEKHDWFLFLATENSMNSKWCPWEIGYADGIKGAKSVVILPTSNNQIIYGSEYLDLYRRIDIKDNKVVHFEAGFKHHTEALEVLNS